MTYELAKQLKEAGFPIKEATTQEEIKQSLDGWLIPPTLPELIEACEENFSNLTRYRAYEGSDDELWEAFAFDEENLSRHGSTPEEAVARLWLALNPPGATQIAGKMKPPRRKH